MTDDIYNLLRFGEDSVTEFKSLSISGHRVAAPATDDTADEIAAAANAAGAAFIFGPNDKTREIEGVKAKKSVNAVAHRDYSISGAKIRLHMFSDRLEIFSPGGLPNSMTLDEIGERQFSRNELICTCLSRCKLTATIENIRRTRIMDRRGEGVPVILAASQELSGKRPEYKLLNESEVLLTLRSSPIDDRKKLQALTHKKPSFQDGKSDQSLDGYVQAPDQNPTKIRPKSDRNPTETRPKSDQSCINDLPKSATRVYRALAADGSKTYRQLADELGINKDTVNAAIKILVHHARIQRIGTKRNGHWEVMP